MYRSKNILLTIILLSTFTMAGGDISPVEPHIEMPAEETSFDETQFYTGLGYTRVRYDETNEEHSHRGLTLQAGYDFNPYIGLEARYTRSSVDTYSTAYTFGGDLDNLALYIKPMLPLTTDISLYALLGYGRTSIDTQTGNRYEYDFQWGAGAKYLLAEDLSLFWDYTQLYEGNGFDRDTSSNDVTIRSVNVGLNYIY